MISSDWLFRLDINFPYQSFQMMPSNMLSSADAYSRQCIGSSLVKATPVRVPSHYIFRHLWLNVSCSLWRHQMETFSALLAICEGNSSVTGEFPKERPVTRSFDVFLDLRLNKRLSKQSWGWWFETPSRPWWRHRYVTLYSNVYHR